jgi:CBS domain-containing protein
MNPELFSLRADTKSDDALDALLEYGITAVPVLDDARRPIGVVSIRDLVRKEPAPRISTPALSISADTTVEETARMMAENDKHQLVVVGGDGRALGLVSSLDVVRALIGLPAHVPATFPRRDKAPGVSWTNAEPFDADHVASAPTEGGIVVLATGGPRRPDCDLWAEACVGMRGRLMELLEIPQSPALAAILARRDLRFRCAIVPDTAARDVVAERLRSHIDNAPLPRGAPTTDVGFP